MQARQEPSVEDAAEVPERFDARTMHGEVIEAEHLARYRWACALAPGRRTLDAGCGTGYGSAMLAAAGADVVGVDMSGPTVEEAAAGAPRGVLIEQGDVTSLDHADGSFDLVVCFEVIEHVENPGAALDEFARVLSETGVLVVSSPNRDVYPQGNPHHLREFTPPELEDELRERFTHVRLERQHTWITSAVLDDDRFRAGEDAELGALSVRKVEADAPGAELYTIALAGGSELPPSAPVLELASRMDLRKWDALWREQDDRLRSQAQVLADHEARDAQRTAEIVTLREQLVSAEGEVAKARELAARIDDLDELNSELLRHIDDLKLEEDIDELHAIVERYSTLVESKSWKVTRPMREAAALLRRLKAE
jgi:SAM-dependent methyltransferase